MTDIEILADFVGTHGRKDSDSTSIFESPLCAGIRWTEEVKTNSFDYPAYFKYNCSWDWLIPVLKKIEELDISQDLYQQHLEQINGDMYHALNDLDIEECFKACVEFIKEYNKLKE